MSMIYAESTIKLVFYLEFFFRKLNSFFFVDFGRNKMVAMALLCGCDYCPNGVDGVGRDAVLKLFQMYSDAEIMARIRRWRSLENHLTALEMRVDDKAICVGCGHLGRIQSHTKNGCAECRSHRGCDESKWK